MTARESAYHRARKRWAQTPESDARVAAWCHMVRCWGAMTDHEQARLLGVTPRRLRAMQGR